MIRWLIIALFIYLMIRLIAGPRHRRRRAPFFRFHYGRFNNQSGQDGGGSTGKNHLDDIEDADYEDITEAEPTESNRK